MHAGFASRRGALRAVHAFESVDTWRQSAQAAGTTLLILWMSASPNSAEANNALERMRQVLLLPGPPPVVVSDRQDAEAVSHAISCSARAFVPAMSLQTTVRVLDIVRSGGTFIPASALSSVSARGEATLRACSSSSSPRQLAVVRAMRRAS